MGTKIKIPSAASKKGTAEEQKKAEDKYKSDLNRIYHAWYLLSIMRDSAKNIFHGSVITDLLDNGLSINIFMTCGKKLNTYLGFDKELDPMWAKFEEAFTI